MNKKEVEQIVEMVVEKVMIRMESGKPEQIMDDWVTTSEAARLLGLSQFRLRQIKERFNYRKDGDPKKNGRLLFERSSLLESYIR